MSPVCLGQDYPYHLSLTYIKIQKPPMPDATIYLESALAVNRCAGVRAPFSFCTIHKLQREVCASISFSTAHFSAEHSGIWTCAFASLFPCETVAQVNELPDLPLLEIAERRRGRRPGCYSLFETASVTYDGSLAS